jgi:GNAT superfamily N-acetyltransferase
MSRGVRAELISDGFADFARFDALNDEAFPLEERIPATELVELAKSPHVELMALYDGDEFVGYWMILDAKVCAYLFFFAIESERRGRGYGSEALALMCSLHPSIVLDMERIDDTAPNAAQRRDRKRFYERNGFADTGYLLTYLGMTFELMSRGDEFEGEGFAGAFGEIKHIFEGTKYGRIEPVLYRVPVRK